MTTLHFVEKARKDNPVAKKGESYYWWQFPFSSKSYSKEKPRRSHLTRSAWDAAVFDLQDDNENAPNFENIEDEISSIKDAVDELMNEQQEKLDNMPDQLRDADSGQLLQERIDSCESVISSLDSISVDFEYDKDKEEDEDEQKEEHASEVWSEVTSALEEFC